LLQETNNQLLLVYSCTILYVCHLRFFPQSILLLRFGYDKETLTLSICATKGGVCLFGLTSNINSVSQKLLTAPLCQ